MDKIATLIEAAIVLAILLIVPAQGQRSLEPSSYGDSCGGPVFSSRKVAKRAEITYRKIPEMTAEALAHGVRGRVKLEAVLCRNGQVTDVRVIEGLPYGMTAKAVESVLTMRFKPAEKNWHTVSEKMAFEFDFKGIGDRSAEIAIERVEGRRIEAIEIVGYRRFGSEQILRWISTRTGDVCNSVQLQRDLEALLKTGFFNKQSTRVFAEEGAQGGVGIVFVTFELPLIAEVKFEGLKQFSEKVILDALLKGGIDLSKGAVDDPEKIVNAQRLIGEALRLNGRREATVEVRRDNITAFTVALTFVISGIN